MKTSILTILMAVVMMVLLVGGTGFAIDGGRDGCMKISFDSLPFFGSSENEDEDEDRPEYVDDLTDEEKYTYDAMGNKVPTRTGR